MNPPAPSSITTSPDGAWVAVRRGHEISLLAGGVTPATGKVDIGTADADVILVGPPSMVVVVVRNVAPRVMLYQPPNLEVVARVDLDVPMRVVAVSGPRIVLAPHEGKKLVFVRVAQASLSTQTVELDGPLDFAVGLEKNQVLVSVQRKLEVWDASTGRAVLRMQLALPPPPRTVGTAQGHVWVTRPNTDDVIVYRLSDGRPFRHLIGSPAVDVVSNPQSPILVVGTVRHLIRLHCFAHSLTVLDAPWIPGVPIAQLAVGEDVSLLGLADDLEEPWRLALAGAGAPALAPATAEEVVVEPPKPAEHASGFRSLREKQEADRASAIAQTTPLPVMTPVTTPISEPPRVRATTPPPVRPPTAREWRDDIAAIGGELVRGHSPELAARLDDSELAALADRLLLGPRTIRALTALYALYLVGEPELSIADFAQVLGDWSEPLGVGELASFGMLRRKRGRVSLRAAVTDLLDGCAPQHVRLVGHHAAKPKPGAWRYAREGKSDAELETLLAGRFGRIAVIEGDADRGLLEAHLRGATAIAFHPPAHRPRPWPRDAALVLVLYGSQSSWIADLPNLD
jgi:hypothetical protein